MANKRIDELAPHPQSVAHPLTNSAILPVRDAALPSDNTKRTSLLNMRAFATNVMDFGADPTGAANSTAAIQAAIDKAVEASGDNGGGIVFVPPGFYQIINVTIKAGVHFIGSGTQGGGTFFYQPNGVNTHAFIAEKDFAGYVHGVRMSDFRLRKTTPVTDTLGSGIYFDNQGGENTRFENLQIESFPESGLQVRGAVTCYFQDISASLCGKYGLFLERSPGYSFTGHYILGVSGDDNGRALIGAQYVNLHVKGVKAENRPGLQPYGIELIPDGTTNWCIVEGISCAGTSGGTPIAYVHIPSGGQVPATDGSCNVWVQGMMIHNGGIAPTYVILDDWRGNSVPLQGTNGQAQMVTFYGGRGNVDGGGTPLGAEYFNVTWQGCKIAVNSDAGPIYGCFGLGFTNGVGTAAAANLQANAKGAATNAPTSLTVTKWVRASLDGVNGWIPFFT